MQEIKENLEEDFLRLFSGNHEEMTVENLKSKYEKLFSEFKTEKNNNTEKEVIENKQWEKGLKDIFEILLETCELYRKKAKNETDLMRIKAIKTTICDEIEVYKNKDLSREDIKRIKEKLLKDYAEIFKPFREKYFPEDMEL